MKGSFGVSDIIDMAILRGSAPVPVDGEATDVTPDRDS
jgi:hypothetical protein